MSLKTIGCLLATGDLSARQPYAGHVTGASVNRDAQRGSEQNQSIADRGRQTDFTHMTRQELLNWTGRQISAGVMELDESFPFVAMTVSNGSESSPDAENQDIDTEYCDFIQATQNAIRAAQSRRDEATADRLEWALRIMWQQQRQDQLPT